MKPGKNINIDFFRLISGFCMMLALAWLTVSAPFVFRAGKHQTETIVSASNGNTAADTEELPENPFTNNTEEKTESGTGSLSEYLHHAEEAVDHLPDLAVYNRQHSSATYIAFHGELLSPPPEMF